MTPFGRYELLALLAKGGLAEIWLARQKGLAGFEKLVVVKRLHERLSREPEYVAMFLDEARINARLQHTNVLSVYELGEVAGQYFLAMEYVEGLPLGVLAYKAMERLGDLPIAIGAGLVAQAAHGLHFAHEAIGPDGAPLHVVHRDVSPLNLLVSFDGILKVADFGIAKAEGRRTRTRSGTVKGTPTYMSPEQCTGERVDRRSDVFCLGIVLWELLSGRRLFKRETADETYAAITRGAIEPPSRFRVELPVALDALVHRALARRPEDRFPTAAALAGELEHILHKEGLRGEVGDVRTFLAEHFGHERAEQEALLQRVRADAIHANEGPLFRNAEHGLDSESDGDADEGVYSDEETLRDAVTPEDEALADTLRNTPAPLVLPPATPPLATPPLATPPLTKRPLQRPPSPATGSWLIYLLAAIVAAAAIGVVVGRTLGR